MSYKVGGFHDTCLEYEVITGDGKVLTCTPENEHALVFQMVHGAFGTLGILSKLTFRLVPAKPFVKLTYTTYARLADYTASIERHVEARDVDFMDGIIHAPRNKYVLSTGQFVDEAPFASRYDWLQVYWESTGKRREDYLTTTELFLSVRPRSHKRPTEFVSRPIAAGKLANSSEMLRLAEKLHWLLPREKPTITLDVFLPISKVPEFFEWYAREFNFFPLWCVPYKRVHDYEWLVDSFWTDMGKDYLFLDLAIYGMRQRGDKNYHRLMEIKLRELGGIKTLIAHNYYPEAEFWSIWNPKNYAAVKAITDPDNVFRNVYSKMCRAAMGLSR